MIRRAHFRFTDPPQLGFRSTAHLAGIATGLQPVQVDTQRPCRTGHRPEAVFLAYFDRHPDCLFGQPVAPGPDDGQALAFLERNNKDAPLRKRIRARAASDGEHFPASRQQSPTEHVPQQLTRPVVSSVARSAAAPVPPLPSWERF